MNEAHSIPFHFIVCVSSESFYSREETERVLSSSIDKILHNRRERDAKNSITRPCARLATEAEEIFSFENNLIVVVFSPLTIPTEIKIPK